jgi:two-component system sensor histidine kinase BaeS
MRYRRPRHRYPYGHPPFARRMGCVFALLIILAAIAARARGTVAIAIALLIALGFALAVRRAARIFAEQIRLRRQLMADVAHELRTPLAILQGRIEGLLDGVYPRDDERLGELLAETQHLARLVEDVRTLANAEAGALDLRKEQIDVGEVIRETASALHVVVDLPEELPEIDADPVRIREVLLNLMTNAVQHAPEGTVTVSAESRPRELVIRVRDNGPGIPAEALPHLFERFQKGPRSKGSGLGLSIARKLVLAHGGTIGVESAEGVGTTVTVSLPR